MCCFAVVATAGWGQLREMECKDKSNLPPVLFVYMCCYIMLTCAIRMMLHPPLTATTHSGHPYDLCREWKCVLSPPILGHKFL